MTAIIEVKDLVKVYNGNIRAVDGITFDVAEGEVFGFLGPNGAGKTTTISVLTTLLQLTSGECTVCGYDVVKQPTDVRRSIGLVPQELTVDDDLTGRENMMLQATLYGVEPKVAKERIDELLALVKLEEAADRMVKTYSGGMRKRLELSEGLIHRPRVLFLDEPTLGLDIQTRTTMWQHIRDLKKSSNMTVFLTTHYLEEADSLCDRIGIIDMGKIMAMDTPATLKKSLGGDVISIKIPGEVDYTDVIQSTSGVLSVKKEDSSYRVKVINGETATAPLLQEISKKGGAVTYVSLERPNMDQVFLEYTGRSLRDAEQSGGFDKLAASRQMRRSR
ncbi:MAG: Trehalose/maltose import ATP-binding protein MalK [Methanomassiliicoccales archaeon PtaU1.Bin124]|nr:MAG: Trehalose/maltose import ATP-binding protein MalK [Methanomassiliicoccales archaeon PtaU1.Bin124]